MPKKKKTVLVFKICLVVSCIEERNRESAFEIKIFVLIAHNRQCVRIGPCRIASKQVVVKLELKDLQFRNIPCIICSGVGASCAVCGDTGADVETVLALRVG